MTHPTLRTRRFSLEGPGIQLVIGLVATVGIVLRLMFPSHTEEPSPEPSPLEAVAAESEAGFAITSASWETEADESDTSTPDPAHSEENPNLELESDQQDEELRSGSSETPKVRWQNLDIAVKREW